MVRLFVALWPPDHVVAELERLHRKDQRGVRFVRPENWHITLRFLGDVNEGETIAALDHGEFGSSTVRLGPGVDLLGPYTVAVRAQGADGLIDEVIRVTSDLGEPTAKRPDGHLTLARLERRAQLPRILGHLVEASWTVDEVTLVRSTLRPDGARYEIVARWPTVPA
jgi:2'-5' RNA ligase